MGINQLEKLISKANDISDRVEQESQWLGDQLQQQRRQQQDYLEQRIERFQQRTNSWHQSNQWYQPPPQQLPPTYEQQQHCQQFSHQHYQQHQQYTPPQQTGYITANPSPQTSEKSESDDQTAEELAAQHQTEYERDIAEAERIHKEYDERENAEREAERLKRKQEAGEAGREVQKLRPIQTEWERPVSPMRRFSSADGMIHGHEDVWVGGDQQFYPPFPPAPSQHQHRYSYHHIPESPVVPTPSSYGYSPCPLFSATSWSTQQQQYHQPQSTVTNTPLLPVSPSVVHQQYHVPALGQSVQSQSHSQPRSTSF